MSTRDHDHTVVPFSTSRQIMSDALSLGRRKHNIHGLFEVDVTSARSRMRSYESETGIHVSFTAFIIACLGKAVDQDRLVHAYRGRRNQLVVFDDVDVNTTIEVEVDGERVPILHIIRAVNKRTHLEISREVQEVQALGSTSKSAEKSRVWFVAVMPPPLRRFFFRAVNRYPQVAKEHGGTVLLTSIGMFSKGAGWGIPFVQHTLTVTVGGIAEKPVVVDGRIEVREMLSVTLTFDHDVVDGAPAARFAERFKTLIESGYGLTVDIDASHQ